MLWRLWHTDLVLELTQALLQWGPVLAPSIAEDGLVRLMPHSLTRLPDFSGQLTQLPLKKWLIPHHDPLWHECQGTTSVAAEISSAVVVGIPPCDLYALDALDRAWQNDEIYAQRRKRLLVVGGLCEERKECACPLSSTPPHFDLFVDKERIWSGSEQGTAILAAIDCNLPGGVAPHPSAPWQKSVTESLPESLEKKFSASLSAPFWEETARHCLGCGACSAVCPTCACFDLIDHTSLDGSTTRVRVWDNCFFRSHGLVAGGHNFRRSRSERLQFRFEHKFVGFGDERGTANCVGCGRCTAACPVGIDMRRLLAEVARSEGL